MVVLHLCYFRSLSQACWVAYFCFVCLFSRVWVHTFQFLFLAVNLWKAGHWEWCLDIASSLSPRACCLLADCFHIAVELFEGSQSLLEGETRGPCSVGTASGVCVVTRVFSDSVSVFWLSSAAVAFLSGPALVKYCFDRAGEDVSGPRWEQLRLLPLFLSKLHSLFLHECVSIYVSLFGI